MSAIEYTEQQLGADGAREQIGVRPVDVDALLRNAARLHGTTIGEIMGASRLKNVVAARHAVFVALRAAGWSYPAIGAVMGRDHTTVMAGVKKAAARAAAKGRAT